MQIQQVSSSSLWVEVLDLGEFGEESLDNPSGLWFLSTSLYSFTWFSLLDPEKGFWRCFGGWEKELLGLNEFDLGEVGEESLDGDLDLLRLGPEEEDDAALTCTHNVNAAMTIKR